VCSLAHVDKLAGLLLSVTHDFRPRRTIAPEHTPARCTLLHAARLQKSLPDLPVPSISIPSTPINHPCLDTIQLAHIHGHNHSPSIRPHLSCQPNLPRSHNSPLLVLRIPITYDIHIALPPHTLASFAQFLDRAPHFHPACYRRLKGECYWADCVGLIRGCGGATGALQMWS